MTVKPVEANLIIYQGATFYQLIQFSNPDGTLVDFTGRKLHLQARQYVTDESAYIDLSTDNGGILVGEFIHEVNGVEEIFNVALSIDSADTQIIPIVEGVYDLKCINPLVDPEESDRLLFGSVTLSQGVTDNE